MKDKTLDKPDLLADNEGNTCPRCGSHNVEFVMPTDCIGLAKIYRNPTTGKVEVDKNTPDGQYYRLKCTDCLLSTKNHVNLVRAITEWNSLGSTDMGK